jgi:hypothetical protein
MQDEDWVWLGTSTAGVDSDWGQALLAWTLMPVSVDQELTTCGVMGSGSCVEERQGDGAGYDNKAEFYGSSSCI